MLKEFDTLSAVVDDPDAGRIEAILRRVGDYLAKQPINVRTSDEVKFGSDRYCCPDAWVASIAKIAKFRQVSPIALRGPSTGNTSTSAGATQL
jgi:hypothetical protein